MTQKPIEAPGLDAWLLHELHRIKRENRIRRTLVLAGFAVFLVTLGVATYLSYNEGFGAAANGPAPITGQEIRAISG